MSSANRFSARSAAWWVAQAAIEVNIGVHSALTPTHLDEKFYIGGPSSVGNAALFAAMLLISRRPTQHWGQALAAATSLAEAGSFVPSRTIGLPGGHEEQWASRGEDILGLICLAADAVVVLAAAAARPGFRRGDNVRAARDEHANNHGASLRRNNAAGPDNSMIPCEEAYPAIRLSTAA